MARYAGEGLVEMYDLMKKVRPTRCGCCKRGEEEVVRDMIYVARLEWFLCGDCRKRYYTAKKEHQAAAEEQYHATHQVERQVLSLQYHW